MSRVIFFSASQSRFSTSVLLFPTYFSAEYLNYLNTAKLKSRFEETDTKAAFYVLCLSRIVELGSVRCFECESKLLFRCLGHFFDQTSQHQPVFSRLQSIFQSGCNQNRTS